MPPDACAYATPLFAMLHAAPAELLAPFLLVAGCWLLQYYSARVRHSAPTVRGCNILYIDIHIMLMLMC